MSSTIESVLQETRVFPPSPQFVKQANISGMEAYRKLVAEFERDFEGTWGRLARLRRLFGRRIVDDAQLADVLVDAALEEILGKLER